MWISEYRRWLTEEESLHNAQIVARFFSSLGWTPQAISAMCGNIRHESSINPDMYEYGYEWEDDRGYGLVQWTPRSKYWNWAAARMLPPRHGDSQLARIQYEIENGIQWIAIADYDYMTFEEFSQSTLPVPYLTEAFMWSYERPARQAGESSLPNRIAFAERVFNELDFEGGPGPGPGPSPGPGEENMPYYIYRRHNTNMRRMGVRGRR